MERIVLKKPAQLMGVVRKVSDRTMNLRFNTDESSSQELASWDAFAGFTGYLVFSMDEIQEEDVPKEDTEGTNKLTASQKRRRKIWVLWDKKDRPGEFNDFKKMWDAKFDNLLQRELDEF